jgi:hypothetical protein
MVLEMPILAYDLMANVWNNRQPAERVKAPKHVRSGHQDKSAYWEASIKAACSQTESHLCPNVNWLSIDPNWLRPMICNGSLKG